MLRALTTFYATERRAMVPAGAEVPEDDPIVEGRGHLFERVDAPGKPATRRRRGRPPKHSRTEG